MKVTVKIGDVEVTIERAQFMEDGAYISGTQFRQDIVKDTVMPTLKEATEKAKELFTHRNQVIC